MYIINFFFFLGVLVAVTLPIWCRSTSSVKLQYIPFVVSRAFMADAASQAGDADSPRAPGLTPGLQGSVNVHRGALLWCHSDSASVLLYFTFLCRKRNNQ